MLILFVGGWDIVTWIAEQSLIHDQERSSQIAGETRPRSLEIPFHSEAWLLLVEKLRKNKKIKLTFTDFDEEEEKRRIRWSNN